jgi:Ca2+/Na+ antiporter
MEKMKLNTDIVARLFAASCLLYPPFAALVNPTSIAGRVEVSIGELFSNALFILMFCIALLIMTDVICNSMQSRERWRFITKYRDNMYMIAAFCTITVPFSVNYISEFDIASCFLYLVIFCVFASLSWCDSYAKKNTVERRGKT